MLDVTKLSLLREVGLQGGITNAAESLRMSPSNISQQLRRMEHEYGVALLEPHGRGVKLTAAAERLVRRTEDVLAILEAAETELTAHRKLGASTVRLVGFHTFAVGLLGSVVTHLAESAPTVTLEFDEREPESAIDEVLSRRADLAVIDEYAGFPLSPSPGIVRIALGREPVHAYLPAGVTRAEDAAWAMEPDTADAARWMRSVCRTAGFEPNVRFGSPDPYVHRRLVEQGLAAAFLPVTAAAGLTGGAHIAHELPAGLFRTHTLILRRGTERSAGNAACREAITWALEEAIGAHDTV